MSCDNGHMRVLVVDDDRGLREVMRSTPDAIVLDVGLPDIDELEVCRQLRRSGNRVPVLMLTAPRRRWFWDRRRGRRQ